jgi:membrane protein DedA with SNARE-associated domain
MIMPFAGWLVATGRFSLWGIALAGAIGCVVGSIPAYYAGQYGGRALVRRYGRYVLMNADHLDWAERFFQRRGDITVLIARLLPVVRTFIAFPAGVARMPMGKFVLYTFVGSFPWCLGLGWVGMKVGEHRELLTPWFHRADAVIVALILAGVAYFVWKQTVARRQTTRAPGGP